MGWRAIRIALDRPNVLRQQLRAMLAAAAGRALWVMFPMVAEVEEFKACRAMVDLELARTGKSGRGRPRELKVGAMIEVPAAVWQLPELLELADFVSVGSNDLHQFLFAADRDNPAVADRYDPLSPAMLRVLAHIAQRCRAAGKPLGVCGEMAGDPLAAMVLLALGIRSLSVAPPRVPRLRAMVRSLDLGRFRAYWHSLGTLEGKAARSAALAYARDHGVTI
jgi:phosphotransferase system enzyme I (PtsP)